MSWESSLEYYRIINEKVKEELGGLHSAKLIMLSVDFQEIEQLQHQGDWDALASILSEAAKTLEQAKSDLIVIATNTMHKVADQVQSAVSIPLLHIADETAAEIQKAEVTRVGLLGTKFTMEEDFYKGRLNENYGINVLVPAENDRNTVHRIIYDELVVGNINPESRRIVLQIIEKLIHQGAEGIILGCTELPLLIKQSDVETLLFDTTRIHAERAVLMALGNEGGNLA